jgi:hypothetical protein
MKKLMTIAGMFAALMVLIAGSLAFAVAPASANGGDNGSGNGGGNSGGWSVVYYNAHGNSLGMGAKAGSGASATFPFLAVPRYAALLSTTGNSDVRLGDLSNSSLTDSFTISGVTGTFVGNPDGCTPSPSARLYFATGNKVSQYNLWWSTTPVALTGNGSASLSASLADSAQWSDLYGDIGSSVPTQFAAATANVSAVGVSFGAYCHAENGVTTSDGSGIFTSAFSVTP